MNERVARTLYNVLAVSRKMHPMSVGWSFKLALAAAGFRVSIARQASASRHPGQPAAHLSLFVAVLRETSTAKRPSQSEIEKCGAVLNACSVPKNRLKL